MNAWISKIDESLRAQYGGLMGKKSVMGVSMGAYYLLHLAAREKQVGALHFERYIAIDAPVDLLYALKQLDKMYDAPMAFPAHERKKKTLGILLKVAALAEHADTLRPTKALPFSDLEASYLIGLSFRYTLRDLLFLSKYQDEILRKSTQSPRKKIYDQLMKYSWQDYYKLFVMPQLLKQGLDEKDILREINLQSYTEALAANDRIRVLVNENDFLIDKNLLEWYKSTFKQHITVFENGGHLGNLIEEPVRKKIFEALEFKAE